MRELTDKQAGEKSARHRAEAECPNLETSDPVARGNHQEQCELRVADQKLLKPD